MMAGLVLVSALVGLMAVAATFALGLPTWMMLAAYPLVCSLTLLMAAVWNVRMVQVRPVDRALHPHA